MTTVRLAAVEDAAAIARIQVDTWRSTYRGIIPDDVLAGLEYERSQSFWAGPLADPASRTRLFVSQTPAGEVVGFACGGPAREARPEADGELYALYVLLAHQGGGHGRALLKAVARDLADRDFRAMIIWVLRDNPACGFYERLGGQPQVSKDIEIGGKQLPELGYVWPDLAAFLKD